MTVTAPKSGKSSVSKSFSLAGAHGDARREHRPTGPRRVLLVEINHDGTFGGSHQAMFDLARHLDPARYTPVALFYEHNPFVERLRALGIEVITWEAE